ncbi:MAG TPA: TetR/AcrR family transcriptional regulator [Rhizomicrobium sp.]|nr:TetR/AcrR family transcriptional regulator [Rhizomicrobium sp.]
MPQSAPQSQRWRRRKHARPQEILGAALVVFAEKGFAAARMEDIAKQAGVTKGTIYLYFPSKDAVFKSLVRESIGTTLDIIIENAKAYSGPSADIVRMALSRIALFLSESDLAALPKIILSETGQFPELARFYRSEIIDKGLGFLTGVIERGIARGEFRAVPPQHAARLCIAPALLGAIWRTTFAKFDSEPYDYKALIDAHIDVLLRGLAKGEHAP